MFEFVVKLNGFGWNKWKRNSWNVFDCVLLCGLCPIIIIRVANLDTVVGIEYMILQAQKFFMDCVAFKLVQRVEVLHVLFKTVAYVLL